MLKVLIADACPTSRTRRQQVLRTDVHYLFEIVATGKIHRSQNRNANEMRRHYCTGLRCFKYVFECEEMKANDAKANAQIHPLRP